MSLDVYAPCPGGTGKKIKFCACGKDMAHELSRAVEALVGGQRAGALAQVNRLLESHGNRACLLAMKASVQLEMEDMDSARETAAVFLDAHHDNPAALALAATVHLYDGQIAEAVDLLQDAIQISGSSLHSITHQAIGIAGERMLVSGRTLGGIAHLELYVSATDEEDTPPQRLLEQIVRSPEITLPLKELRVLLDAPEGVAWRESCDAAVQLAQRGSWKAARDRFAELAEELEGEPRIWRNLAIVESSLGHHRESAVAWRRYAFAPGIDFDEAVEAEALAQLLMERDPQFVDSIVQSFSFSDHDRVMERLLSDRTLHHAEIDLASYAEEGSPAPRAAFFMLDREMPRSAENLVSAEVPMIVGQLCVFGRETDREPRIELSGIRRPEFLQAGQRLKESLGDYAGEQLEEKKLGEVDAVVQALSFRSQYPSDATVKQIEALRREKQAEILLQRWPETELPSLQGKRPVELVADPQGRIQVAAAILLLELVARPEVVTRDYGPLRVQLGLPEARDIDPEGLDLDSLPLCRLHRLPPERLSDDQLLEAFHHARVCAAFRAVQRMGAEVVQRPGLRLRANQASVYGVLSTLSTDADQALELIQKAQQAVLPGQSPAPFLLLELEFRTARQEHEQCELLFQRLQTQHSREPGVAESLYRWLVRVGAIRPDGSRTDVEADDELAPASDAPPGRSEPGIWTPGQTAAPAPDKPGLWLPGQS